MNCNSIEVKVIREKGFVQIDEQTYQQVQIIRNENDDLKLSELVSNIKQNYEDLQPGFQVFYKIINEMNQEELIFAGIDPISDNECVPFTFSYPNIVLKFRQKKGDNKEENKTQQNEKQDEQFWSDIIKQTFEIDQSKSLVENKNQKKQTKKGRKDIAYISNEENQSGQNTDHQT